MATNTKRTLVVGTGVLTWDRSERISDRYGFVYLMSEGSNSLSDAGQYVALAIPRSRRGALVAVVIETRQSTHIGDLFRGVSPNTPEVGEEITLATGRILQGENADGKPTIGVEPDDERERDWLDIHALYRAHEQTVRLEVQT